MKILHLSPHVGGGVGTVVSNYIRYANEHTSQKHTLICLDRLQSASRYFLNEAKVEYLDNALNDQELICDKVQAADVVILHWWNHPLTGKFLCQLSQLPAHRLIMWCHISGLHEPNVIPNRAVEIADLFVFTSPLSYGCKNLKTLSQEAKTKLTWIWSTRGFEYIEIEQNKVNDSDITHLIYVGNLDFAKVSSSFFHIAEQILSDRVHLDIIGPTNSIFDDCLSKSSARKFISNHGFISEDEKHRLLQRASIFFYPLNSNHYGTCDQTIQEAMMHGVVPVTFSNPMERYMVDHLVNGLIADGKEVFIENLKILLSNNDTLSALSTNARRSALNIYSLKSLASEWSCVFAKIINMPKILKKEDLLAPSENLGYELFKLTVPGLEKELSKSIKYLNSSVRIGADAFPLLALAFEQDLQNSQSKSSIRQFIQYFPKDKLLRYIADAFAV